MIWYNEISSTGHCNRLESFAPSEGGAEEFLDSPTMATTPVVNGVDSLDSDDE